MSKELAHRDMLIESLREALAEAERQRDRLLAELKTTTRKMFAYVGVCNGDKELTDDILPAAVALIAEIELAARKEGE